VAGHQHHAADAGRRRGAGRCGDAFDGKRRGLGAAGALFQFRDGWKIRIKQIKVGKVAGQLAGIGKAGERIVRRHPCHGDSALGELRRVRLNVIRRHNRLAAPHQRAQPHIVAFGALGFLDRAVAHLYPERHRAHRKRVGGIGAGPASGCNQPFGEVSQRGLVEERGHPKDLRSVFRESSG
jgi:hypothetical protein